MTTDNMPDAGQELAAGQAQEAADATPQARQEQAADERRTTYDADYVEKLRKEAADHRKRLREAESELTKRREAEMTEAERMQAEAKRLSEQAATLEAQLRTERVRSAVALAASELRLSNAGDLADLLNPALVEYDDAGQPTNVKKLLQKLTKALPQPTGTGNPARGDGTREQLPQRPSAGDFFNPGNARSGGVLWPTQDTE